MNKLKTLDKSLIFLSARLREPSSKAAFAAMLAMAGANIQVDVLANIINLSAILFGFAGVFTSEQVND